MPDALDRLLRALCETVPAGTDARLLADAVWLAAARAADADLPESPGLSAARLSAIAQKNQAPAKSPASPEDAARSLVPVHALGGSALVKGTTLSLSRADAVPRSLAVARSLQPLRRPWRRGRQRLDIDATVEHYVQEGLLLPVYSPAPERWFDVVVVADTSLSMAVWKETTQSLTTLLGGLGAFRDVHTWHLRWRGAEPVLHDHRDRVVPPKRAASHGGTERGRRLLFVISDCAARGWRRPQPWQFLTAWGRDAPVVLVNPLPQRLWRRSALNLPAVRTTALRAGATNAMLRFHVPARLHARSDDDRPPGHWQALPVASCTPRSLGTWAATLMNANPHGCDAVLVPAAGRLSEFDAHTGQQADPAALTESFLHTAAAPAVRLAVLCSHLPEITVALLHVLREQAVPDAQLTDIAELLTSGLFSVTHTSQGDPVMTLLPAAAERLRAHLTTDDMWQTLKALDTHVAAHTYSPRDIPAVLEDPEALSEHAASVRPVARASEETLRLLGLPLSQTPADSRDRELSGTSPQIALARAADHPTRFSGELHEVREARLAAEEFLRDLSRSSPPTAPEYWGDILLVVTELAANAVQYAPGPFELRLRRAEGEVHVTLSDTSTAEPSPRPPGSFGAGGVGWHLIQTLCTQVSVVTHGHGKDVHAFLPW